MDERRMDDTVWCDVICCQTSIWCIVYGVCDITSHHNRCQMKYVRAQQTKANTVFAICVIWLIKILSWI